jgi:prepilin-type N-terminal cleavage/methylation domain-containing protein/prepilin-type processing-associated H-X9-DG protein
MKRAFTLLELVVVVAIIGILAAILFPVLTRTKENPTRYSCQSNLKLLGLGFVQYAQDYEGFLPSTKMGATSGWAAAVYPYVKSRTIFQCPATQNQAPNSTDYFFNMRLSRGYSPNIKWPSITILGGDGDDDMPLWAHMRQIPTYWLSDETSPAWRHRGTANYLFADGHVKWFKPNQISDASSQTAKATFAIR